MKTTKFTIGITFCVLVIVAIVSFSFQKKSTNNNRSTEYSIAKVWELPAVLDEVSGITWLPDGTIASVQDEDGVIFIYDLAKKEIIEKIEFAGPGDYEGIAIHKDDAYVLRSDGTIYEVLNFRKKEKTTTSFKTGFSTKNNMETLALDINNKSLIIAPKDRDNSDEFKGVYHIPLTSKTIDRVPIIKINMDDGALKTYQNKKLYKTFSPSDIAIHPKTGDYYVLEGKNPKLIILNTKGSIKKVYELEKNQFPQPEGITFSPDGTLYISSEAGDGDATIMQVNLK
jgi:uncharacterized protein YjiK